MSEAASEVPKARSSIWRNNLKRARGGVKTQRRGKAVARWLGGEGSDGGDGSG